MKKKNSLILDEEFTLYCQINKIDDIERLAKEIFNRGFSIVKYGETPSSVKGKEKIVEKEVIKEIIKEVIVEVPVEVEKIVEIEVIKEVPIQGETTIVTKEIIKEVKVTDQEELNRCNKENENLKKELEDIKKSLDKFNKAKFMKNSDLNSLYGE